MRKFVRTYTPFLVYFVCVALAYFREYEKISVNKILL